jgi:hypothetical protein
MSLYIKEPMESDETTQPGKLTGDCAAGPHLFFMTCTIVR